MSTRSEDDSRPERKETSARNTARDVPAARFKEGSVGTIAPRGLRGPSLLPGQGAPERIEPEDVELAVLRDAETLDGPHVARVAYKRLPDPHSPSPTPVSVEVPRVRSMPPAHADYPSTPPSPSARSIQSGTLMSIGSVDPRAPTELSLPGPRPLSFSERAVYLGPEAVVDRTPSASPRELPGVVESGRYLDPTLRPGAPSSEQRPNSSARGGLVGSGAVLSARPSLKPDSEAPPAQKFIRPPHSYSPVSPPSPSARESRPEVASSRRSLPGSAADAPRRFQIHSELDALRHELSEDNFDLRSASTQREPLASRKQLPSSEWTPQAPSSGGGHRESEPGVRSSRHSVPGAFSAAHDAAPPTADRVTASRPQRASVPLVWVLGSAAFAVVLALIVAWVMRSPSGSGQDSTAARAAGGLRSGAAPSPVLPYSPEQGAPGRPAARHAPNPSASAAPTTAAVTRVPGAAPKASVARAQPSAAGQLGVGSGLQSPVPTPASTDSSDSNSKVHQSIY
ncbi:MAG: hypothetical protein ABIQ16_27710 [Polyangiaceae bacterium]